MTPTKDGKQCQSLPLDILTNLPNNVIDVILMCLPCKDRVRTSILSKKWRYNWCRLPELGLHESHWEAEKIMDQYLTHHEGTITKFTLKAGPLMSCPKIDNFISFLSRNGIQQLVLDFLRIKKFKLPCSLFSCSELKHLTLHSCSMCPPSGFKGFDRLISLELCNVLCSSELLGHLISHCPLLEQLVLDGLINRKKTEINAPMLRSFDFKGCMRSFCLKNVPLLAKVSVKSQGLPVQASSFDFARFFESCNASLEHLRLDFSNDWTPVEEADEPPTRLPFDLDRVKHFYLLNIALYRSYELSGALCLLRSFPHLEYLEIKVYVGNERNILESLEDISDVTFNHLMEVKLVNFTGTTPEMQLLKLLLAKSPVLVRMLINPWALEHEIFAEISTFLRASPNAEIVYEKRRGGNRSGSYAFSSKEVSKFG